MLETGPAGRGADGIHISAHDTTPQNPPAASTASGFECAPSPPNLVSSCLLDSYATKYVAVPMVSRTVSVSLRLNHRMHRDTTH